jgi:peptidoglycan/xylan/chitin deacetylase (PgdA/CDA1 family)
VKGLGEIEQRRFGPRVGIDRILDLMDEFNIRASFYVPGYVMETYPEVLTKILDSGHEIGLHGYFHEQVDQLSQEENETVLDRSIEVFRRQTGEVPRGYRSPAWDMTPGLLRLLRERGVAYDSSLMGYDHPYSVDGFTEIPVQWLTDDAPYFRFRGFVQEGWPPVSPLTVEKSWIEEFEGLREHGGLFTITVHPWISGRSQRIRMHRRLIQHIQAYDDVWWATAYEIADYHARSVNATRFDVSATLIDTNL